MTNITIYIRRQSCHSNVTYCTMDFKKRFEQLQLFQGHSRSDYVVQ